MHYIGSRLLRNGRHYRSKKIRTRLLRRLPWMLHEIMLIWTSWPRRVKRTFYGTYSSMASFYNNIKKTDSRQYSRPCKREDIRICRLSANKSRVVYFVPKSKLVLFISYTRLRESLRSYVQERDDKAPLVEALALSPELLLKMWTA